MRAVVLRGDERPMIGHVGFHGPPGVNSLKAADAVEVGYTIFPDHRRRATPARRFAALLDWARAQGIDHFVASVGPQNEPSLAIVRRLGFREVGRHWDDEDGEELEFELTEPVVSAPPVRYADSGGVEIAYQVLGEGPPDIIWLGGALTHLEHALGAPGLPPLLRAAGVVLAADPVRQAGMGLSERTRVGTLDDRMDDARAVLDATGSERAVLLGVSEGGPMSMVFAATYPERVQALLLVGAEVKEAKTDDWPWGEATPEEFEALMAALPERWGEGLAASYFLPDDPNPERTQEWFGRLQMMSATPRDAMAFMRMAFDIDVRDVVSAVHVPTLVLHRVGDNDLPRRERPLPRPRDPRCEVRRAPRERAPPLGRRPDRRSSTRSASSSPACARRTSPTACWRRCSSPTSSARRSAQPQLGDRRWRELLDAHHAAVRRELERFRGREIDTAGDGFLASFDGPARAIRCAEAAVDVRARARARHPRRRAHRGM